MTFVETIDKVIKGNDEIKINSYTGKLLSHLKMPMSNFKIFISRLFYSIALFFFSKAMKQNYHNKLS